MLNDIRLKTLLLLDESFTSDGKDDYLSEMDAFIDMAQKQLAEVMPIRRTTTITTTGKVLPLAADMRTVTAIKSADMETTYPLLDFGGAMIVPGAGEYLVEYSAYPATIPAQGAPATYELEIAPEAQEAIPYFAAAMCVPDENPQLYAFFLSQYNERIANMNGAKRPYIRVVGGVGNGV